jgi:hypothetical protein
MQALTVTELLALGEKYLLEHDYEKALVHFLEVIEVEPMNPRGYTGAAEAYVGLDRADDAVSVLRSGLTVLPENPDIRIKLVDIYIELGMLDEAMAIIEQGMVYSPDHPGLNERLERIKYLMCDHTWLDAHCLNPRFCTDCEGTEGTPVGHVWIQASFHEPQICSVCRETEGDPLIPEWMESDYADQMEAFLNDEQRLIPGQQRPIVSWWDEQTIGMIEVLEYKVFESGEGYEALEGYKYQAVTFLFTYTDEDTFRWSDWHWFDLRDLYVFSMVFDEDCGMFFPTNGVLTYSWLVYGDPPRSNIPGLYTGNFLLNFYGEEFEFYISSSESRTQIGRAGAIPLEVVILAPAGYDGFIISFPTNDFFRLRELNRFSA